MIRATAAWVATAFFAVALIAALIVYRDGSGEAAILPMIGYAAALPILSLIARDWWAFVAQMSIAFVVAFIATLIGLEIAGAAERMGPAGMAYLFPVLVFVFGSAAAGAIRLAVMAYRQATGRRGDRPFISPGAVRNMVIVALAASAPFALASVLSGVDALFNKS